MIKEYKVDNTPDYERGITDGWRDADQMNPKKETGSRTPSYTLGYTSGYNSRVAQIKQEARDAAY